MYYQFQVDGRPSGPRRNRWIDAAQDAVNDGYATWASEDEIRLEATQGAAIARIGEEQNVGVSGDMDQMVPNVDGLPDRRGDAALSHGATRSYGVRNTRPAIIFDIDGTLSKVDHRLHFITGEKKDWDAFYDACDQDPPNEDIVWIAEMLGVANFDICMHEPGRFFTPWFCTGRVERVRGKTVKWLGENIPILFENFWENIMMRPDGDFRADHVLKAEMLGQLQNWGYEIRAVFDDRQRVVDMWREVGLTALQVNAWEEK